MNVFATQAGGSGGGATTHGRATGGEEGRSPGAQCPRSRADARGETRRVGAHTQGGRDTERSVGGVAARQAGEGGGADVWWTMAGVYTDTSGYGCTTRATVSEGVGAYALHLESCGLFKMVESL